MIILASNLTTINHRKEISKLRYDDAEKIKGEKNARNKKEENKRTPSVSRNGTSSSPVSLLPDLMPIGIDLLPSWTTSTNLRFLSFDGNSSSSCARSTKSATSSPKSPIAAIELMFLVVAACRLRSCFVNGTRVNKSSSILARASMRACSLLTNALRSFASPSWISSGSSPSSCASSCIDKKIH